MDFNWILFTRPTTESSMPLLGSGNKPFVEERSSSLDKASQRLGLSGCGDS